MHQINEKKLNKNFVNLISLDLVPIGKTLNETNFFLQNNNENELMTKISNRLLESSYERTYEGLLFHHSPTRVCLVNNEKLEYLNSGDMVKISDGQIYLKGRSDRSVKLNGKFTDLVKLEMVTSTNNCRKSTF